MFRRNSSRLQHRAVLRRSKSAGSVGTRNTCGLTGIEPLTARSDAHIAARVSFTKARAESSENENSMAISASSAAYGLTRSHSFMNGPDHISCSEKRESAIKSRENNLCRKRSVRFTGPTALEKRDLASRAHETWTDHGSSSGRTHLGLFTAHLPKSSPSPGLRYADFWLEDRSVDLDSGLETTFCASDSSLYPVTKHKLRKSRSMFTTSFVQSDRQSESTTSGATDGNSLLAPARHAVIGTGKSSLRSPKSMSFLRMHAIKETSMRGHHHSSLSTSPSKVSLSGSTRLKSRPSMFFRSRNKRNASLTEIRTSLRNSSCNSMPTAPTISSTASSLSKASGLRNAARKVSKRMKSKFRGIFGRIKKPSETTDDTSNTEPSSAHPSQLSLQEEASLSRVKSYAPSLRSVASEHCLNPRQGSLEVVDDGAQQTDGERSRVTSWTNSSTHTLASTQDAEWEPQRLSVIDEGGNNLPALDRWRSSEDEVRAYSALVQRLDDMQKQQSLDMHSGDDSAMNNSQSDMTQSDLPSSTRKIIAHRTLINGEHIHGHEPDAEIVRLSRSGASSRIASPSGHLFRTHSPYRRALRKSMRVQDRSLSVKPMNLRYLSSLSALSLPIRRSSPNESENDCHLSSAASVYSCLSDYQELDKQLDTREEELDFDHSASPPPPCIYEASVAPTHEPDKPHRRAVSTASSVEWKTWLSAKVSKLEDSSQSSNEDSTQSSKALGEEQTWNPWIIMGHVREDAEIEPTSNPSDTSDVEIDGPDKCPVTTKAIVAPQMPQNIVIDNDIAHNEYPTLIYDENSHPALTKQGKQTEDMFNTPKSIVNSNSSPPNSKASEVCDMICRGTSTPQKQRTNPHTFIGSRSDAKKNYFSTGAASSLQSSPGLSTAVRRQFGTIATGSPRRRSIRGGEEVVPAKAARAVASLDDCQFRKGLDAQAMGSKRMVELFLNSRKTKRGAGGQADASASEWSTAFL